MKTLSAIKYFGALAMSLVMGFALVGCDDDKSEIKPSEPLENEFDRVECTIDIIPASDMRTFADMSGASYTNFSGEDVALGVATVDKQTVIFKCSEDKFPKTANVKFVATPKENVNMQEGKNYNLGHTIKITAAVYSKDNTVLAVGSQDYSKVSAIDSETNYVKLLQARYPLILKVNVDKSGEEYVFTFEGGEKFDVAP